jgi:G3E family GTPase
VQPDVFLAEPVGSCTDLRATVQLPLARLYGDAYRVAPLSVLVDPLRAARAFGVDPGPSFSSRVLYIYDKQLEEADVLVLNKIDIIPEELRIQLEAMLAKRYPDAGIASVSARTGSGLEAWLERLLATPVSDARPTMEIDYDLYADGEALLGWVNATLLLRAERDFDGNHFLGRLAHALREQLASAAVEIAHLKMTLAAGGDRATINLVRSDGTAELARRLSEPIRAAELTINLRAEEDPERLHALMTETVADVGRETGVETILGEEAHFRPGRPVPTHRMVAT